MARDTESEWLEFYRKTASSMNFNATAGWETVKFHIVLSSSLISVTFVALVAIQTSASLDYNLKHLFTLGLVVLPITMLFVVRQGGENFKRECERMYDQVSILMKLEDKFGFYEKRDGERHIFLNDDGYFPKKFYGQWYSAKDVDSDKFREKMMSSSDTFYSTMRTVFMLFTNVSYGLIALIVLVVLFY
jgi:hypothetical protein